VQWSSLYNQRCHHWVRSFGDMAATTARSVFKLQSTCKVAALFGLSLV